MSNEPGVENNDPGVPAGLRLAPFIRDRMDAIQTEWDVFARTLVPAAETMSKAALSNHAEFILRAITSDMDAGQTEVQRDAKSKGGAPLDPSETAATVHGVLRHLDGFNLTQLVAEFRALRATVLRLWKAQRAPDAVDLEDVTRFNEGIDQALAESIASYSSKIDESRDTFLAVLGHDLRGPLSAFGNCVQLLQRRDLGSAGAERLFHLAARSISTMNGLVVDLLEYTRTRLGKGIDVVPTVGDFAGLCLEVVEEARVGHPKKTIDFTASGASTVAFDASRMRQVVSNLLNNAVQHGAGDSPVDVRVAEDDAHVSLTVANQGKPIPPEALQVIFNPLVQVAISTTEPHERPSSSMGLGLFIAWEIVKAHTGSLTVASTAEAGTVFTVRLPKQPARTGGAG